MKITLQIPEAVSLSRVAATLASALSTTVSEGDLHTGLSAGDYFRLLPWTGKKRAPRSTASLQTSTVGQYFSAFDWEGSAQLLHRKHSVPKSREDIHNPSSILSSILQGESL